MLTYAVVHPQKIKKKERKVAKKALAFLGISFLLSLLIYSFFSVSNVPQTKASPDSTYTIKNPYTSDGNWYVGQLHFHTNNSDGSATPAAMEVAYYDAGYDFVVTADHRGTSPSYCGEDDGLTPDPDNSGSGKDLLWILGQELSISDGHMVGIGVTARNTNICSGSPDMQTAIDEERTNSGITMLAHPRYSEAYSIDWNEATGWKRYSLVEIANGLGPEEFLDDIPSNPTDLADDFYQIWWTGVDDAHNNTTNVDKWCVVVQTASSSISQADLLSSLDSGNFYTREGPCSTGVNLTGVSLSDDTLTVTLDNIESTYTVKWYKRGRQLAETDSNIDTTANYTVTGTEGYVFAEITRDSDNKRAYTQPFFIGNKTDLSNSVSCGGGSSCNNIIDNNPSTYWDAGAGTGNFTIDVGSSKLINAIKIQWSSSGSPSDRWNYKIETSPDNSTWTEQMRTSFSNRQSTTIDFFDVDARYVKVTVTGQSVGGGSDIRVLEAETFDSSPERTNYYINNVSGSDSNNGLTPETAWQNWNNALPRVRPRDTLNLINSGTAYAGGMDINIPFVFGEVGKHQYARFVFQGESSENRTPVNATGSDYGIRQTRSYVDIRNFEIYNAVAQGAGISFTAGTGSTIDNCILRNNQRRGFVLNGGQNATIQNSYIYGNGEGGIQNYNNSGILNVINCQIYSNNGIGIGSEFSTSINIRRTVLSSYKLNNNNWLQSSSISS